MKKRKSKPGMYIPIILLAIANGVQKIDARDTLIVNSFSSNPFDTSKSMIIYLNFGIQNSNYAEGINSFLPDHFGPSFELEAGINWKIVGYFSPWTLNPEKTLPIWNHTLYDYDVFNPIKAGMLFGKRIFKKKYSEWGFVVGTEWVTLAGFNKKEELEKRKISMPTTAGSVFGIDYRRDLIVSRVLRLGTKLGYRYTTPDYRIFNKSLDYGTHEILFLLGIGGKSIIKIQ
jgi:hypothetical protein